jgi:uncharacterized protein (TIGR03083 family)
VRGVSRVRDLHAALRSSHLGLADAVVPMTADQLMERSYCQDWTIAQLLSHLGSGAEIFGLFLESGLSGGAPPDRDASARVWDRWNAMTPGEQASGCLAADIVFLERLDGASDAELDAVRLTMFGMPTDAARLLTMRLAEHAVHAWDVMVMNDPAASIAPDAVDGVLDNLEPVAGWTAKPGGLILEAEVITSEPARALRLSVGDVVTLSPAGAEARPAAEVRMPAESLIRLVYGRLDPDHTPTTVSTVGVELDTLRALFPGV